MKTMNNKFFRFSYLFILYVFLIVLTFQKIQAQELFINEFMASNVISTPEIIDYDDYSDWIELYNNLENEVDLGGYYLTDDLNDPAKWRIPDGTVIDGNSHILFWADGYNDIPNDGIKYFHLNFKLSKAGEEIGLFSPAEILIDSISYSSQLSDISYGRQPDGSNNWFYFGESTPNQINNTSGTTNKTFSDDPQISLNSGFYSGQQTININSSSSSSTITYTTDGSNPKRNSQQYTNPISISKNTTLRARLFENDKLPSKIVTRSYFIDQSQNLPTLSLTVFPETFFDSEIGIYNNEIKSREVPINVHYFEKNGDLAFNLDAGVRLSGQASFRYPQKPLTIEADDRYGDEFIDYKVFPTRSFNNYSSIYLRNSGTQDNRHTMFRDALQHTLVINKMDIDCQAYQPAATYINGQYWGIYNLREKLDKNFLNAHHNVEIENVDYLEFEFNEEPIVLEGSADEYKKLVEFLENNNMNDEENWAYVTSQIDVNEVMNYLITEIYCDNINWPNTNSRWWREKSEKGKWRYILLDLDYGFGAPSWLSHYSRNTFEFLYNQPPFSTIVFRKLFENIDFRNEFIQRFATHLNTTFSKERALHVVDSLKNQIKMEMSNHINRWDDDKTPIFGYPPIPNVATWNDEVEILREFADKRPGYMRAHISSFYNLAGVKKVQFNLSDPSGGSIYIGGIKVKNQFLGDYFTRIPITIKAVPAVGYKFVKWLGISDSLSNSTNFFVSSSQDIMQITAVFEEDGVNILPEFLVDNLTLDLAGSPYYTKGDITIINGAKLTVNPGVEIIMGNRASIIVNGVISMNGTLNQPIVIKPNENSGFEKWGNIYLDNSPEQNIFSHAQLIGATNGNSDNQIGAISGFKSDISINHTTILDAPFPIFIQYGKAIINNCKLHSEETSDLINVKYADFALVENCDLRGSNAFDADAIDYDQIANGIIRNNKIYNFTGFNSDGIDLGEGCKDIIIENNLIFNCNDKAISVGQASTTTINNNIIVSCAQGVGIKDYNSYAKIDRNTFSDCDYGVASFEKNLGSGGGSGDVINSIFYKSVLSPVFVDNLSTLNVSYSLSDTEELVGLNNYKNDPQFFNNFKLDPSSPAIDAGDPASTQDPDNTTADLGANYFTGNYEPLLINEIHPNPHTGEGYEFIELYNSGEDQIDISGYKLLEAINYIFPNGTIINSKEYILIAKDNTIYSETGVQVFGWGNQSLPENSANIVLNNKNGVEIDFVSYTSEQDWPNISELNGYSLELINPTEENLIANNWKLSTLVGGSPGKPNKLILSDLLFINELQADNKATIKDEFGEFGDWIEIYNADSNPIKLSGFYITDDFTNLTKHKINIIGDKQNTIAPNDFLILWADDNVSQGDLHLNFKLDNNGEGVALVYVFEEDTTIVDSISFGEQEPDYSFARKNDGENNWITVKAPTPLHKNSNSKLFNEGILLVNGYFLTIEEVIDAFENKAFWGNNTISFWDLFTEPSMGYPSTLPEPIGNGYIGLDTLTKYSTVIWVTDHSAAEYFWERSPVLEYVKSGGNLLLLVRTGKTYLEGELLERLGLTWVEATEGVIDNCTSNYSGINSISTIRKQVLNSIFSLSFSNSNSKLLFTETVSHGRPLGIGVWNKPPNGGWYKDNGGQIVYLSGRAQLYNNEELKNFVEYSLKYFFEEGKISPVEEDDDNDVITEYSLKQNFPNPFNPTTVIKYNLVKSAKVELKIFDVLGQEIKTLVNGFVEKGRRTILWNGTDANENKVSSGIYFYRISANNWSDIKKMVLLK